MVSRAKRGTAGEDLAVAHLEKKGYRILQRNFRFEHGEIDIVAEIDATLVFVEVKARRSSSFGEPEDAVTGRKRERIHRTASGYLFERNIDDRACRFDIIAISRCDGQPVIRHIEDAF
jgi:putative endonuclease